MTPHLIDVPVEQEQADGFRGLGLLTPQVPTLRRFSDTQLQAAVDKVLAGLPADRVAAELEVGADAQGVQCIVAVKLQHGWSLRGGGYYDYDGEWGGQVAVRWEGK